MRSTTSAFRRGVQWNNVPSNVRAEPIPALHVVSIWIFHVDSARGHRHANAVMTPIEIEQRATAQNRSMASVLRAADWDPQLWQRWKRGLTTPSLAKYEALIRVLKQ